MGFEAEPFRDALSGALELLGAEPLARDSGGNGGGQGRATWTFPALDRRTGADPTWAATLDTLRPPRRRDQKLADWRREALIRPVVFEDAGVLGDDIVHLHLEQRVAQRLLARFRAQGFVHHDLQTNMRYWRTRLDQFDRDLEQEPGRIRAFYEVQAKRVEPVGLVYLWPETS